jgi:hypothetical protein
LGFSPSADFTPTGARSTMRSTMRPCVRSTVACPPIGLPDPGLTPTVVTPPASATSKPSSNGSIASIVRTAAWFGPVISFVSLAAAPSPSGCTPRCTCASMRPGVTVAPCRSTTSAPSGTSTSASAAAIRPSSPTTIVPS